MVLSATRGDVTALVDGGQVLQKLRTSQKSLDVVLFFFGTNANTTLTSHHMVTGCVRTKPPACLTRAYFKDDLWRRFPTV